MAERLFVGDEVTILPPCDDLPLIFSFQHYARVASSAAGATVVVELSGTLPPNRKFNVPAGQLALGWKDHNGRWRQP